MQNIPGISSYGLGKSLAAYLKLRQSLYTGEKQEAATLLIHFCACSCKRDNNDPLCSGGCRLGDRWNTPGWPNLVHSCFPQYETSRLDYILDPDYVACIIYSDNQLQSINLVVYNTGVLN